MPAETPTLVLLHPFPLDSSFWGPMWRELDADVTLLTPEFPGMGAAAPMDEPSIDGFADAVADEIRRERTGPPVVVGVSMGGYVAQSLAVRHADTVSGLVLANTRADADDDDARAGRNRSIDTIAIDGLDAFIEGLLPRLLSPNAEPEAWDWVYAIASRQEPDAVCAALEALRDRADRSDMLESVAVPTVVVIGRDDQVAPREAVEALAAAIPGTETRVLDGCGHLSAIERPAEFAGVVRELLDRVAGRRSAA